MTIFQKQGDHRFLVHTVTVNSQDVDEGMSASKWYTALDITYLFDVSYRWLVKKAFHRIDYRIIFLISYKYEAQRL